LEPPSQEKPVRRSDETQEEYHKKYMRWYRYWKRRDISIVESQTGSNIDRSTDCRFKYGIPDEKKPKRDDYETEKQYNNAYKRWYGYYWRRHRYDVLRQEKRLTRKVKFIVKPVPAPRLDLLPPPPAEWLFPPPPAEWLL
jgi:hypothetical protein